jgi:opacity protein-like surface antigen
MRTLHVDVIEAAGEKRVTIMSRVLFLGALASLYAAPALAQDDRTGAYLSLNAGLASVDDLDVRYLAPTGTFGGATGSDSLDFAFDLDNAAVFGGAIGYDFGMVRADIEVSYHRNKAKSVTLRNVNGAGVTLAPADRADVCDYLETDSCAGTGNTFDFDDDGSKLRQLSALANLWLDIPLGSVVTPYIGGGIGATGYELDGEAKGRFAWQLGAGAAINLSPAIALTADYRHRQAGGVTIVDEDFADEGVVIDKVKTNTFTAGIRFRF